MRRQRRASAAVAEGNVGAGAGATVGKLARRARTGDESGLGSASISLAERTRRRRHGRSQRRRRRHRPVDGHGRRRCAHRRRQAPRRRARPAAVALAIAERAPRRAATPRLAIVATNARLTKAEISRMALMADDGLRARVSSGTHAGRRRHRVRARDRDDGRARPTSRRSARSRPTRSPKPSSRAATFTRPSSGGLPAAARIGRSLAHHSALHAFRRRSRILIHSVSLHLALLVIYSCVVVGARTVDRSIRANEQRFFVAGRSLGPGLILASMLAANIGAGATVDVAGLAYREGLNAWWWSGSAGLASFVARLLGRPATVDAGEGARLLHDRRLPRVPLRRDRPRA